VAAFKAQTKNQVTLLAIGGALVLGVGLIAPASFMQHFIVFVLSVFVGFQVIWNVAHAAHAADGRHQRDFVDHHPGRADADRVELGLITAWPRSASSWPRSTSSAASSSPGACSPCSRNHKGAGVGTMEFGFTIAAYVVAAVLFILSLGGLSGQESAKRAVWYGIVGMAVAVSPR
jgi:hypothetical protein